MRTAGTTIRSRWPITGQDGGSGVTECSPPVTYSGPDGNPAKIVGQCRDAVGHLSDPVQFELRYDHTKPARPVVKARRTTGGITVSWTSPGDVVSNRGQASSGRQGEEARRGLLGQGHPTRRPQRPLAVALLVRGSRLRPGRERRVEDACRPALRRDPAAGRRGRAAQGAARPLGAGREGALLQRPAVAREEEAPDHVALGDRGSDSATRGSSAAGNSTCETASTRCSSGRRSGRSRRRGTASSSAAWTSS